MIARIIEAGYLYEIIGLGYYVSFLIMQRPKNRARFSIRSPKNRARFSIRSKMLTFGAAFALVASVPFGYVHSALVIGLVILVALAAIVSTFLDARDVAR